MKPEKCSKCFPEHDLCLYKSVNGYCYRDVINQVLRKYNFDDEKKSHKEEL